MAKALLGISPGTRVVGLAVIQKGVLVEWKVKTFKEMWSGDKRRAIIATIDRVCEYHGIQVLALKKIDPLKSSPQLDRLVGSILKRAKLNGIKVCQYSLSDLDYDLQMGKKQNKSELTEKVASKHPEVQKEYLLERNNRKEYYTKMFEAIAMAEQYKD
jgi:hypothetical protein